MGCGGIEQATNKALDEGSNIVMLDNFDDVTMKEVSKFNADYVKLEVSDNVTIEMTSELNLLQQGLIILQ